MANELAIQSTKTKGYLLFLIGMFAEIILVLSTLMVGEYGVSPLLLVLFQFIPLVCIEAGLYFIIASKSMQVGEIRSKEFLDSTFRKFGRVFFLIAKDTRGIIAVIIAGLIFIGIFVYSIVMQGFSWNMHIVFMLVSILLYLLVLRKLFVYVYFKVKKTKASFFVNPGFWISIAFVIVGIVLLYAALSGWELPGGQVKTAWKIALAGLGFLAGGGFFLYYTAFKKTIKYVFRGGKLVLFIPHMGKGKEIILDKKEITKVKKLTNAEYLSLEESYDMQFNFKFRSMIDYMQFGKGKIKRPRYYCYNVGAGNLVLLEGKGFVYIIDIANADQLLKELKHKS